VVFDQEAKRNRAKFDCAICDGQIEEGEEFMCKQCGADMCKSCCKAENGVCGKGECYE